LMVKKKALQEIPDKCKYYNIEKHPKWGGGRRVFSGKATNSLILREKKSIQLLRLRTPIHTILIVYWLFKLYPAAAVSPDLR